MLQANAGSTSVSRRGICDRALRFLNNQLLTKSCICRSNLQEQPMRAANLTCSTLLLLVMSVPATIATAQTGNAASPPLGKLIDVGGYRVHLYCAGNGGPPVVIAGGGYSFDWGLIQPEVAKFTEVCAYDHSGIGWSDSGPADSCGLRVDEIHTALRNAGVKGPYVLIGYSLGALVVRLYA